VTGISEEQGECSDPPKQGLWHAEMEGFLSRYSEKRKSGFLCWILLAVGLGILLQK